MVDSLYSVFDIMSGLEWPADALALPDHIIKVEYEYEHAEAVTLQLQILASGLDEVEERKHVPDTGQHPPLDRQADLARALEYFQELERIRFGVSSRDVSTFGEIIYELAEDYYTSEDERMEDLPSVENSPNPSILCDLEMEGVTQLQCTFSKAPQMLL